MLGADTWAFMAPQPDPDMLLLERVAQQDKAAFQQLYLKYHGRVYQYLLRLFRVPQQVEEILNDVMLVVWEKAGAFRGQSRVSTWIFGIAYRKGLKSAKRFHQHKDREPPVINMEAVSDQQEATPVNELEAQEFSKHVERGLKALSIDQRSVVELTILGYSYPEIAQIVDCPVNTVKTRMFHARSHLRAVLRRQPDQSSGEKGNLS